MNDDAPFEPIFVVGCQRSGSTMLGSMLGGSPDVITIPEAQFVAELIPPQGAGVIVDLRGIIDQVEAHYRFKIWQFDLRGKRPTGKGTFADAMRWLMREYAERNGRPEARFWVDHQPGHIRYLARLRKVFPNLKVIHLVRDGRAVSASIMPLDWGPNTINRAAYFWLQRLAWGFAAQEFLPPGQYDFVRYEDILLDPESQMRRLADFVGVDYVPELNAGMGLAVPAFTQNQHALVGQAPKRDRLDAWKKQLTPRQVEIFEAICADMLDYLGYETVSGANPRPLGGSETLLVDVQNIFLKYANVLKFRKRVRDLGRS